MSPLKYFAVKLKNKLHERIKQVDFDILGNFYGEFVKYGGSDGNSLGIVLTPRHITNLMCDLIDVHKQDVVLDPACGFRVIIVIEANSYVNIRSSRLLPKFKTQKINSWCAA